MFTQATSYLLIPYMHMQVAHHLHLLHYYIMCSYIAHTLMLNVSMPCMHMSYLHAYDSFSCPIQVAMSLHVWLPMQPLQAYGKLTNLLYMTAKISKLSIRLF